MNEEARRLRAREKKNLRDRNYHNREYTQKVQACRTTEERDALVQTLESLQAEYRRRTLDAKGKMKMEALARALLATSALEPLTGDQDAPAPSRVAEAWEEFRASRRAPASRERPAISSSSPVTVPDAWSVFIGNKSHIPPGSSATLKSTLGPPESENFAMKSSNEDLPQLGSDGRVMDTKRPRETASKCMIPSVLRRRKMLGQELNNSNNNKSNDSSFLMGSNTTLEVGDGHSSLAAMLGTEPVKSTEDSTTSPNVSDSDESDEHLDLAP